MMLVLTRKIDQGIVISGNIVVRVLGVERDRVKIGISAPLNITVLRQELLERDANEKHAAGKGSLSQVSTGEETTSQT
jgi:carbon storage regulator